MQIYKSKCGTMEVTVGLRWGKILRIWVEGNKHSHKGCNVNAFKEITANVSLEDDDAPCNGNWTGTRYPVTDNCFKNLQGRAWHLGKAG